MTSQPNKAKKDSGTQAPNSDVTHRVEDPGVRAPNSDRTHRLQEHPLRPRPRALTLKRRARNLFFISRKFPLEASPLKGSLITPKAPSFWMSVQRA